MLTLSASSRAFVSWSSVAGWCEETLDNADVRRATRDLIRTVSQRFVGFWALQLWGVGFFQLALDDRLLSLSAVVIWGWFVAQLLRFSNASSAISPGDLYVKSLAVIERSQQSEDAHTKVYSVHTPMHKLIKDPALSGRRLVSKRYLVALLYMLLGMACGFAISALWLTAETVLVEGKAEPVLMLERIDQAARHVGCWLAATLGGFLGDLALHHSMVELDDASTEYHETKVLREHQRCLDEWQEHCHQLGLLYFEQTGKELPESPYLDPPYNRRPKLMGWIDPQQLVVPEPGAETEVEADAEVEPLTENPYLASPIDNGPP